MFSPSLNLVILFVDNPKMSEKFYQSLFNINPIESSLTFVMFQLPNQVMLGLWSRHTAEPPVTSQASSSEICFPVEDVDQVYEHLSELPLSILQKPTDMDFGRTFVIKDPDGHRIRIYKLFEAS